MRNMLSPCKKTFQKPNILRRKPKVSLLQPNNQTDNESLGVKSLATAAVKQEENISGIHFGKIETEGCDKPFQNVNTLEFTSENEACEENELIYPQISVLNANNSNTAIIFETNAQINNNEKIFDSSILNIESFLNSGASKQNTILFNIDGPLSPRKDSENEAKHKWCLELINDPKDIVKNNYGSHLIHMQHTVSKQDINTTAPLAVVSSVNKLEPNISQEEVFSELHTQNITAECLTSKIVKFKCEAPNCNKGFWSEQKLQKHMNAHNKQKATTQITKECPVKNTNADGVEESCGRMFPTRNDLLKHLNEDHTLEDALYRCAKCGRRFFWASGLRTHSQSMCARALACGWPGCGRVFRQPCRLREHARAHTGDRPYPCRHPNCGWAFRSASKLMRHARRHTDERRHQCSACGRAFLRREHLRDHFARYHLPHARDKHLCSHAGCDQTFTNMSTLYMHMKKVHRTEGGGSDILQGGDVSTTVSSNGDNMFVISLVAEPESVEAHTVTEETVASADVADVTAAAGGEAEAEARGEEEEEEETRAARTHCTWPLAPRALAAHSHAEYTLEEDVQVEQSEGSESNIYTVRSDLFLHGNVLINEDSEHMGGATGEPPLDLLDSHPTIDLMQEELMYADAAVDESSFRVFLLNGEELT